jgi:CO/xanthine dehydrogenase FAD-binding subunit
VRIPVPPDNAKAAHTKFAFHERPTATVACLARVADGQVAEARIAVGSVGARPVRAPAAEQALTGAPVEELENGLLAEAGELAAEAAAAVDDANGSSDYKAQLVRVLVGRTFGEVVA